MSIVIMENLTAVAYIRTSSAANVGADKDSDEPQQAAVQDFAKHAGFRLVGELNDAAVSAADRIESRRALLPCWIELRATGSEPLSSRTPAALPVSS